jgi:hypothetical protein
MSKSTKLKLFSRQGILNNQMQTQQEVGVQTSHYAIHNNHTISGYKINSNQNMHVTDFIRLIMRTAEGRVGLTTIPPAVSSPTNWER